MEEDNWENSDSNKQSSSNMHSSNLSESILST